MPATIVGTPEAGIIGTPGDDVIVGGRASNYIRGLGGDDLICGGPGDSAGGNYLYGGPGDDTLIGGSSNDFLAGGQGEDLIIGRPGDDYINGWDGNDSLRGGPGADIIAGDTGDDEVFGGRGPDSLSDHDGNNTLRGGRGDDVTNSGPGNETIRGGRGRDTVDYRTLRTRHDDRWRCSDVTVDLSAGRASGTEIGTDTLDGIENVWTGGGNDVLIGDDGPNEFKTGSYPCDQSAPHETVIGNAGLDLIIFAKLRSEGVIPAPVQVDLQAGTALWIFAGADWSGPTFNVVFSLNSIENVTGTRKADVLRGNAEPNNLTGGRGDDIIDGREGDDQLLGDKGGDTLDGGPGENHNDGGQGTDTCLNPTEGPLSLNCEH